MTSVENKPSKCFRVSLIDRPPTSIPNNCKKMRHPRPLFRSFSSFQANIIIPLQQIGICEKMSIQYTVLWFEPVTFGTWVSSYYH